MLMISTSFFFVTFYEKLYDKKYISFYSRSSLKIKSSRLSILMQDSSTV